MLKKIRYSLIRKLLTSEERFLIECAIDVSLDMMQDPTLFDVKGIEPDRQKILSFKGMTNQRFRTRRR
jgi:hypothetical protein